MTTDPNLVDGIVDDGRPLLDLTAVALLISGGFALFLSFRREFLPHDIAFLGLSARELCALADCRIVQFMFHDRVAFGGALIAIAVLYLWLAAFPLRAGERWAWWAFAVSGALGFASFLAYLGYGYLDTWHGAATLVLIPCFVGGLWRTRTLAVRPSPGGLPAGPASARLGRSGLIATGAGLVLAGLVIVTLGSSFVFVPQDLAFIGQTREQLDRLNPRLVPLIAHDRAGFGGGLLTIGVLVSCCAWYARPSRAFSQALFLAGATGFGCAIGVHYVEGYTDAMHLAPAWVGALLFFVSGGLEWMARRPPLRRSGEPARPSN
jgi:hypothetical protein